MEKKNVQSAPSQTPPQSRPSPGHRPSSLRRGVFQQRKVVGGRRASSFHWALGRKGRGRQGGCRGRRRVAWLGGGYGDRDLFVDEVELIVFG